MDLDIMEEMVVFSPKLWEKAMETIRLSIGGEAFDAWITPATLEDYSAKEGRFTLSVPNDFYRRWIERRYLSEIEQAFTEVMGLPITVEFVTEEDSEETSPVIEEVTQEDLFPPKNRQSLNGRINRQEPYLDGTGGDRRRRSPFVESTRTPAETRSAVARRRGTETPETPRLNPRYLFDEFVVGESNRYAHAAAVAVSDPKARAFNPLFIYGGSGLGKTHLMQAIGHRVHDLDPRLHVVYITSEQFMNGFIDAIQNKRHVEFREAYRNVDLLLIDDVQFLTGKERTQQEFFHTFNALYDAGKKVVVTSDRPPKDLSALEERLRSRFEWGLLVDIQSPDLETRVAILRKKAKLEDIELPNDVIFFIAERITENIREMEGALKRLRMTSALHGKPIDLETARDVLSYLVVGAPQPRVSVEDVQRSVCKYFGIRENELLGNNRSKKYSQPRHLAQYLCRKLTNLSFPDIAQKFGGKDHTSIIYACRKVENQLKKDPNIANVVEYLSKQVTKGAE